MAGELTGCPRARSCDRARERATQSGTTMQAVVSTSTGQHQHTEHADRRHVEPDDSLVVPSSGVEDVAQPKHVKEERRVVCRRRDVQRVLRHGVAHASAAGNRCKRIVGRKPRALDDLELHLRRHRLEDVEVVNRKRIARQQHRSDAIGRIGRPGGPGADDGVMIAGLA